MSQEEILRMARESGMSFHLGMPHLAVMEQLGRFATLVHNKALDAAAAKGKQVVDDWKQAEDFTAAYAAEYVLDFVSQLKEPV